MDVSDSYTNNQTNDVAAKNKRTKNAAIVEESTERIQDH